MKGTQKTGKPLLRFIETLEHGMLNCPYCQNLSIHQTKVEVFDREEDMEDETHTVVEYKRAKHVYRGWVNPNAEDVEKKNPSDRRQGLLITFCCETCEDTPVLAIAQHKGLTLIDWYANDSLPRL
jgi:ribosomal protein L44E